MPLLQDVHHLPNWSCVSRNRAVLTLASDYIGAGFPLPIRLPPAFPLASWDGVNAGHWPFKRDGQRPGGKTDVGLGVSGADTWPRVARLVSGREFLRCGLYTLVMGTCLPLPFAALPIPTRGLPSGLTGVVENNGSRSAQSKDGRPPPAAAVARARLRPAG